MRKEKPFTSQEKKMRNEFILYQKDLAKQKREEEDLVYFEEDFEVIEDKIDFEVEELRRHTDKYQSIDWEDLPPDLEKILQVFRVCGKIKQLGEIRHRKIRGTSCITKRQDTGFEAQWNENLR